MAFTYDPTFNEISTQMEKDKSTPGRFTFTRKMYFKPDIYDEWSKGENWINHSYSQELVDHPAIPKKGEHLTGSLSSWYCVDIDDISNMNADENGEACSYGVVSLTYENKKPLKSSSFSYIPKKYPWEEEVRDFSITNQEVSVPFTEGYVKNEYGAFEKKILTNTAGQPLYGFTTGEWIQRCTWTIAEEKKVDYAIKSPIINSEKVVLFGKINIDPGEGLLLPPSYRRMFWQDSDDPTKIKEYGEWSFEIIVNAKGHGIKALNVGTEAKFQIGSEYRTSEIYSWSTAENSGGFEFKHSYGPYSEMMEDKNLSNQKALVYSKNNPNLVPPYYFNGGPVQRPIPLTESGGIYYQAIENSSKIIKIEIEKYKRDKWNIGIR